MVLVEVFQVGAVMHPVMGRCIKDKFEPGAQFIDGNGMDTELVDQAYVLHEQYPDRMKTHQGHPGPEEEGSRGIACPGLPEGSRQVIPFRGMMYYMRRPEPIHIMAYAMEPV